MLIKRLQKNFTIADNRIIQNDNLTISAKGLYFYMLSLPNDCDYSEERRARKCKCGVSKIKTILKELFEIGLLKREFYNYDKGYRKANYIILYFDTMIEKTTS